MPLFGPMASSQGPLFGPVAPSEPPLFGSLLDSNRLRDALQSLDPLELDRRREQFEDPPPPYCSGETTRVVTPTSAEPGFNIFVMEATLKLKAAHQRTTPRAQFLKEVREEHDQLWRDYAGGKLNKGRHDSSFDGDGLACCIVRDRWKRECIWRSEWDQAHHSEVDKNWNVNYYVGANAENSSGGSAPWRDARWMHEEPLSEQEAGSENEERLSAHVHSLLDGKSAQQRPGNQPRDAYRCKREASRPHHRFRHAAARAREVLANRFAKRSSAEIERLAHRIVKKVWKLRGIWDRSWLEMPASHWQHEASFATFLSHRGLTEQQIRGDTTADEPEDEELEISLPEYVPPDQLQEFLTGGEDRAAIYAALEPEEPRPVLDLSFFGGALFGNSQCRDTQSAAPAESPKSANLSSPSQDSFPQRSPRGSERSPLRSTKNSKVSKRKNNSARQRHVKNDRSVAMRKNASRKINKITISGTSDFAPRSSISPPVLRRSPRIAKQKKRTAEVAEQILGTNNEKLEGTAPATRARKPKTAAKDSRKQQLSRSKRESISTPGSATRVAKNTASKKSSGRAGLRPRR